MEKLNVYDVAKLRKDSEPLSDYLISIPNNNAVFAKGSKDYHPDETVVKGLKRHAKDSVVVVFSAEWCPDCANNLPPPKKIAEGSGLDVRVFGHLMRNPLNQSEKWKIPPSPPEVKEFNVVKIPLIVVLNKKGEKLGEIVENPPKGLRLEEALLRIYRDAE